jgi:hypothetical protein
MWRQGFVLPFMTRLGYLNLGVVGQLAVNLRQTRNLELEGAAAAHIGYQVYCLLLLFGTGLCGI